MQSFSPLAPVNKEMPASVSALRFTSANRTCSRTCWLSMPPGTRSRLITFDFDEVFSAISPAFSITALLETRPESVVASSLTVTEMSSPGNRPRSCCWSGADAGIDHQIVLNPLAGAPHDQADRAGRLAIDEDFARRDHGGVGDRRIRDGDAGDVEVGRQDGRTARRQRDAIDRGRRRRGGVAARAARRRGRPALAAGDSRRGAAVRRTQRRSTQAPRRRSWRRATPRIFIM